MALPQRSRTNLMAVGAAIGVPQLLNEASHATFLTLASSRRCAWFVNLEPLVPRITPPHVHAKVGEVFPIDHPERVNIHKIEQDTHPFHELPSLGLTSTYRSMIGALPQADSAVELCYEFLQRYPWALVGTPRCSNGLQGAPEHCEGAPV